jgi:hypothetical protein
MENISVAHKTESFILGSYESRLSLLLCFIVFPMLCLVGGSPIISIILQALLHCCRYNYQRLLWQQLRDFTIEKFSRSLRYHTFLWLRFNCKICIRGGGGNNAGYNM